MFRTARERRGAAGLKTAKNEENSSGNAVLDEVVAAMAMMEVGAGADEGNLPSENHASQKYISI
jgi:hypothetical protein